MGVLDVFSCETSRISRAEQRLWRISLCPTEGYAEEIVVPPIPAEHFELKHSLINLVTSKQFFGFEERDPLLHIPRIWLDKEPPHSILTWDDLVSNEAWDQFKDLLRACPHHSFTELHQLDTFYNGLNPSDQDSLNSAASGNLLEKSAQDVLKIIENKSKVCNSRNKPIFSSQLKASNVDSLEISSVVASAVTSAMTAMFKQHQVTQTPASVKAVEESCVTCGSAHSYRQCPATDGNTFLGYQDNIQGYVSAAVANDGVMKNMQTQMTSLTNSNIELKNMFGQFMKMNTASTLDLGSLPSNIVANPRGDLKAITTRSGISYNGPSIPLSSSSLPKVVEREPEVTKDMPKSSIPYPSRANKQKLHEKDDNLTLKFVKIFKELHFELSFADALLHMPKFASMFKSLLNNKEKLFDLAKTPVNENCSVIILKKLPKKLGDPDKFLIPCDFPELVELDTSFHMEEALTLEIYSDSFDFETADRSTHIVEVCVDPQVPLILGRPFLRTTRALIDVYGEELTLRVDDEAITFKVGQTLRCSYNDAVSINQIGVIDVACEEYAQEVLGFADSSTSGNSTPSLDPILTTSSPPLTPFEESNFILEEI
ncbi:hypothetical protein Tco_0392382 [Tanacetum coccineum]